jgi:hypothetical protein
MGVRLYIYVIHNTTHLIYNDYILLILCWIHVEFVGLLDWVMLKLEYKTMQVNANLTTLQKICQIVTCILTRVRHCTRVKMFATSILTRVLRVSDVKDSNCTF